MAFQEVVLFIPKLPLHLCVNESHDSFSINSVGEQKGKKSKGWDWHFTLWKLPKKSYFLHFGIPLRRGQVSETKLSTARLHHPGSGSSAAAAAAKSLQLCLTLCDPIDGSPPGPTVPGILQTRTLEWVAISFSKA